MHHSVATCTRCKKGETYKRGCKINGIARPPLVQHLARKGLVHDVHHLHHAATKAQVFFSYLRTICRKLSAAVRLVVRL